MPPDPPVTPADVRAHLATTAHAAAARAAATHPAAPAAGPAAAHPAGPAAATFSARLAAAAPSDRDAVLASISSSYFRLRRGLAVVAFLFPIALALVAGGTLQASISAYYHYAAALCPHPPGPCPAGAGGTARDVFVGGLWMIGSFLGFYRGYSRAEDLALNLAGVAAVTIALSPMDWPAGAAATTHGMVHGTSAVVFFLCIAYVAIFRARDTADLLPEPRRGRFVAVYRGLGALMVVLPLGAVALHLLWPDPVNRVVLAVEVAGIYVFAAFWLVKSYEIALIERGSA